MKSGFLLARSASVRVGVLLLVIVGVEAVVLLHVFGLGSIPLTHHDYQVYHRLAVNLLEHGTFSMDPVTPYHPTLFRSFGFPAFIAMVYMVAGKSVMALRIAQFILIWLTAWILYLIGTRFSSHRSAAAAAIICATYPPFVFMAPLYATHCLSLWLTSIAVLGLVALDDSSRFHWLQYSALGVCLGILTLVSAAFELVPVFFAIGLLVGQPRAVVKRRLGPIALLFLSFSVVIVPWIVRNHRISGGASGTSLMVGGWGLYHSAEEYSGELRYGTPKADWDRSIAHFNLRSQEAARSIPDSDPYAVPRREVLTSHLLTEDALRVLKGLTLSQVLASLPPRLYWLWSTSDVSPWQTGPFHRFTQVYHVLVMGLVLVGCYTVRRCLLQLWPLWVLAVYQTLLHLVFHVEARCTLDGRLLLLVFAGMGLEHLGALFRRRLTAKTVSIPSASAVR